MAEQPAPLVLSPAETGVPDRLVWRTGPDAGASAEWWTNEATLGRSPENTFVVDDPSVSRRHARLTRTGEGVFLEDCGSGNGTRLDGVKVVGPVRLRDGGLVELGSASFAFETLVTTVTARRPAKDAAAGRLRRRLLVALAIVSAVVAGGVVWKGRSAAPPVDEDDGAAVRGGAAADPVPRAEALARRGRWVEAEAALAPVWAAAEEPGLRERWAFVQREAAHQRRLDEAAANLKAGDLAGLEASLAAGPDDSAQVARRDDLRQAGVDSARKASEAAAQPVRDVPAPRPATVKVEEPPRPVPAKGARAGEPGPPLAAWLSGDSARALELSTDPGFTARVRALDAAWSAAKGQAQAGNAVEAVRQLADVRRLAAELSGGRASSLGAEASRLFAAQAFKLAMTMRSDEELGRRAARLAEAVEADPQERYRSLQAETWTRCRDLYQQAYVARGPAPDEARQWFRTACKCLPPGDEKQARACTFARQLGDAP